MKPNLLPRTSDNNQHPTRDVKYRNLVPSPSNALNLQLPHNPRLRLQRQTSDLHPREYLRLPQLLHIILDSLLKLSRSKSTVRISINLDNRVRGPRLYVLADTILGQMSRTTI